MFTASPRFLPHLFFCLTLNGKRSDYSDRFEFRDKAAAWQGASVSFAELIQYLRNDIEPGCDWRIEVTDSKGNAVYRFRFMAEEL